MLCQLLKPLNARRFFAQEMETLINLLTGNPSEAMSLGGSNIEFLYLRDILPEVSSSFNRYGRFVDLPQPAIIALREEWTQRINRSFIDFIQFLYARNDSGEWIMNMFSNEVMARHFGPAGELSHNYTQQIENMKSFLKKRALFQRTRITESDDLSTIQAIDIAVEKGNAPAVRVLKNAGAEMHPFYLNWPRLVISSVPIPPLAMSIFDLHPHIGMAIFALLFFGNIGYDMCQHIIRKHKRNQLAKDSPMNNELISNRVGM